ncbi:hypothetical protein K2X30_07655 [bacterium]|nr:hypothetical protein [bacterium]
MLLLQRLSGIVAVVSIFSVLHASSVWAYTTSAESAKVLRLEDQLKREANALSAFVNQTPDSEKYFVLTQALADGLNSVDSLIAKATKLPRTAQSEEGMRALHQLRALIVEHLEQAKEAAQSPRELDQIARSFSDSLNHAFATLGLLLVFISVVGVLTFAFFPWLSCQINKQDCYG